MAQRIFAIVAGSCALSLAVVTAPALPGAIVITEIHYNPPVSEANLEFVEISNDSPTPQDISGWEFTEGIEFLFPQGTLLLGNGILVVCADAEAVRARYGVDNAIGNFEGRLSAAGERLTVVNHSGIVVQSVRYQDDGKWPVGPDGTGHSLVLRGVRLDPKEPESWDQSPEVGGSPGRVNFPPPDAFVETVLIDAEVEWRFARGFQAFSDPPGAWSQPEFDDAGWEVGTSGFGIGDDDDSTVLEDMQGNYSSVAVRKRFVLETEDIEGPGRLFLGMTFDDGFCAWLNGEEIARVNCPDDPTWNQVATRPHEARREEAFPIPPEHVRVGENVLAIVGFNRSLRGNDFSLLPRLLHRQPPQFEGAGQFRGPFNELYRSDEPGDSWVELYN
ncbi:MAG: lamin tail domain-containing protein, partial [Planctomycetota bacterium]|nr:lamin tail domain-containing protein [Planctomycetota bacterium]